MFNFWGSLHLYVGFSWHFIPHGVAPQQSCTMLQTAFASAHVDKTIPKVFELMNRYESIAKEDSVLLND